MSAATDWASRLKAYELAKADVDNLGEDYTDAEGDFYSDVHWAALDRLILTPAPDLAAFARKVMIFLNEEIADWTHSGPPTEALLADARRFEAQAQ